MVPGIDISSENGTWNWEPWKEEANTPHGLNFAGARATSWNGPNLDLDPEFQSNWRAMLHMGLVRIAYCEPRPGLSAPNQQANAFWHNIHKSGGTKDGDILACALDPQYSGVESPLYTSEWYGAFCLSVNDLFPHHRVIVYTNLSSAESGETEGLERWHLWLAEYGVHAPTIPRRWEHTGVTFWQSTGTVPPDRDVFHGDRKALDQFALAHVR